MRWERTDTMLCVAFASFVLATRVALRARYLLRDDSILFALAMEDYDLMAGRPHAPGYPLYIALARFLRPLFASPEATLTAMSALASVAAIVLLYAFGRVLLGRRAAALAAGLFALSPVFFLNGIQPLTYTFDAAFTVAVAWAAWAVHRSPRAPRIALLALLLAAAVGFRQSNLFFLTPLAVWAVWPRPFALGALLRRAAVAAAAGVAATAAWFLPMLAFGGGWSAWRTVTDQQSAAVFYYDVFTFGWPALRLHLSDLLHYVRYEGWLLVALLMLSALAWLTRRPRAPVRPKPARVFFALWILPSVLFYLLFFSGLGKEPTGYALVFVPPMYLLFGRLADRALAHFDTPDSHSTARRLAAYGALALAVMPALPFAAAWGPLHDTTVRDRETWAEAWQGLGAEFPPNETVLLTDGSWYFARWYFPEHTVYGYLYFLHRTDGWQLCTIASQAHRDTPLLYDAMIGGSSVDDTQRIPDGARRIVLFDHQLAGEHGADRAIRQAIPIHETTLASGWRILYVDVDPARPLLSDYVYDFAQGEGPGAWRYA